LCNAADDVMERIKQLEQQIQELKQIKEQQNIAAQKSDDCMKAFGREKFCSCISTSLPRQVSFEQYVHTMVLSRDALGYATMSPEQRAVVDATIAAREACVEKGFFR
jgi:hypothetical protein